MTGIRARTRGPEGTLRARSHAKVSPVPPGTPGTWESSRWKSVRKGASAWTSARERTRAALMTRHPVRRAASVQNTGPSSPWNWSIVSPTSSATRTTWSSVGLTNTPTIWTWRRWTAAISTAAGRRQRRRDCGHWMSPSAQAPAATAASASSGRVMPQNLILGAGACTAFTVGAAGSAQQRAQRILHVGGAHEGLADEHGVDARGAHPVDVRAGAQPRLGDDGGAGRHLLAQLEGALEIDPERREVAVVDADHAGREPPRALELGRVVDLDEDVEPVPGGVAEQRAELVVGERGDDEQDRVGAARRGLRDLVLTDDEVLAQQRQRRRAPGPGEILERAPEADVLGEHRDGPRTPALVGAHHV